MTPELFLCKNIHLFLSFFIIFYHFLMFLLMLFLLQQTSNSTTAESNFYLTEHTLGKITHSSVLFLSQQLCLKFWLIVLFLRLFFSLTHFLGFSIVKKLSTHSTSASCRVTLFCTLPKLFRALTSYCITVMLLMFLYVRETKACKVLFYFLNWI